MKRITLVMKCPDQKGINAEATNFIHNNNDNIVYIDQSVDRVNSIFFMRVECEISEDNQIIENFKSTFERTIGTQFQLKVEIYLNNEFPKMALFVSKYDHYLYDILARHQSGELAVHIPFILSNHLDLKSIAERFEITFYHIPITKENKKKAEEKQLQILQEME